MFLNMGGHLGSNGTMIRIYYILWSHKIITWGLHEIINGTFINKGYMGVCMFGLMCVTRIYVSQVGLMF